MAEELFPLDSFDPADVYVCVTGEVTGVSFAGRPMVEIERGVWALPDDEDDYPEDA